MCMTIVGEYWINVHDYITGILDMCIVRDHIRGILDRSMTIVD